MTADRRLSEKYPAVVVRKRDSPQVIVVSRVRAQPIQTEKEPACPRFCLAIECFPLSAKQLACGHSSGVEYHDIVDFRVRLC